MITLKINNVEQTNFILSTPYKDTIDDELDQFNFQIKSQTRLSLKKYDKVEYKITQPLGNSTQTVLEKVFALFGLVETWECEYWLYQITCLSPTKLLENLIINGMADTYSSATFMAQLTRVKDKINTQLSYEMITPPQIVFKQTGENPIDYSVFGSYAPSDFLWDGQVNVREIFNDMFDKADMICIGTDFEATNGNITSITIGAVKRELKKNRLVNSNNDIENGGLDDVKELVKGLSITRNSELACGNIISLIKNAVCKDNVQQAYLPARNDDLTIDDSADWHIITQEPIYSLNKVVIILAFDGLTLKYEAPNQTRAVCAGIPIDITNYIVEKDVFDAMSLKEQKKHLYFKRGEKGIYGLYKKYKSSTPLWSDIALYNVLYDLVFTNRTTFQSTFDLGDYIGDYVERENAPILLYSHSDLKWDNVDTYVDVDGITRKYADSIIVKYNGTVSCVWATAQTGTNDLKQCFFSINYQPYCDSVVKIEKANINDIEANSKNLSVLKNQNDRTIDASKYYDSQQSFINRMGNKEMTIDSMIDLTQEYTQINTLWNLGDYFTLGGNDWTITQREVENYSIDMLKVKYKLSKDFNASNVDIQLKRDKRLYGIPLNQYVDRFILIRASGIDQYIKKIVIQCWDDFTLNQTENTSNSELGYCLFEAIKIGNNDIVNKVVRCKDNYAVDIERTKYSSTIVNINLRYCDTDGYKENIQLYTLSDTGYNNYVAPQITTYSRLPFIPATEFQNVIDQGYAGNINLQGIKKDKMERLIFVFREA